MCAKYRDYSLELQGWHCCECHLGGKTPSSRDGNLQALHPSLQKGGQADKRNEQRALGKLWHPMSPCHRQPLACKASTVYFGAPSKHSWPGQGTSRATEAATNPVQDVLLFNSRGAAAGHAYCCKIRHLKESKSPSLLLYLQMLVLESRSSVRCPGTFVLCCF